MKKIAKMAVGLTAVAMAASAFAGGPEMAPPTISGFNVGLGFGYDSYSYSQALTEIGGTNFYLQSLVENTKFGPVGEIGYTFQVSNWAFLGLRAFYKYDNFNAQQLEFNGHTGNATTSLQSHIAVVFLGGIMLNGSNAAYIELGYTALWGKSTLAHTVAPGGSTPVSTNYTLSGGIAGIGWRHYFVNNVYLDLSYDFSLYEDGSNGLALASTNAANNITAGDIKRVQVNGVTATLNYLFNV